jgi:hypothetical protein
MTPDQVIKAMGHEVERVSEGKVPELDWIGLGAKLAGLLQIPHYSLAGGDLEVTFGFDEPAHRLRRIGITTPREPVLDSQGAARLFGQLKGLLVEEYGKPAKDSVADKISMCEWSLSKTTVLLLLRQMDDGGHLNLTYTDKTFP